MKLVLRLFIVFFIGLGVSNQVNAQDFRTRKADNYFEQTYYSKAIPLYENVIDKTKNPQTILNLADAYYFTFEISKAKKYYRLMAKRFPKEMDTQHYFHYVQTLKALGDYTKAESVTKTHLLNTAEERKTFEKSLHYLENVKAIGKRFDLKNLDLNTSQSEFGGTVYDGKFIFAATKKHEGLFDKIFYWNDEPYLNLYAVPENKTQDSIPLELFSKNLTTRFHESNAVFSSDGKTIYFTRNNYIEGKKIRDKNDVTQLQIYKAELRDGKWQNTTSLPINGVDYSTEHPALSPDGKTLYFASNKPGGFGGFDLYKVNTNDFQHPENLGENINTPHKEQFPFLAKNGNLYFASDGHPGFGFLDVFVSKPSPTGFQTPDNVGFPINSGYDDFAFSLDTTTKNGYFSSNRPSGKGSDDIYKIHENLPLIIEDCYQFITGTVTDKSTGELLPNAKVVLEIDSIAIDSLITDESATFRFKVECGSTYRLTGSKLDYQNDQKTVETTFTRKKENDADLALLSKEAVAQMAKEMEAHKQSELEAEKKESEIAKKKRIAGILKSEKIIVQDPAKNRFLIKTEPIYFDYDLWYIRKESRVILNRVIALLNKYPHMKIEIGTHTDARGTKKYNRDLSEKRANSVLAYFEKEGIDANRITAKGYGESQPIIICDPVDSCTEEQHEINRRCEFVILSFG